MVDADDDDCCSDAISASDPTLEFDELADEDVTIDAAVIAEILQDEIDVTLQATIDITVDAEIDGRGLRACLSAPVRPGPI